MQKALCKDPFTFLNEFGVSVFKLSVNTLANDLLGAMVSPISCFKEVLQNIHKFKFLTVKIHIGN